MVDSSAVLLGVAIASPVLFFAGGITGHLLGRRASREAEVWRHREETMRMLRWGAERAVDVDARVAKVGLASLTALATSQLLQPQDQGFVALVTEAVLEGRLGEVATAGAGLTTEEE